jgi:hypothetical protein
MPQFLPPLDAQSLKAAPCALLSVLAVAHPKTPQNRPRSVAKLAQFPARSAWTWQFLPPRVAHICRAFVLAADWPNKRADAPYAPQSPTARAPAAIAGATPPVPMSIPVAMTRQACSMFMSRAPYFKIELRKRSRYRDWSRAELFAARGRTSWFAMTCFTFCRPYDREPCH